MSWTWALRSPHLLLCLWNVSSACLSCSQRLFQRHGFEMVIRCLEYLHSIRDWKLLYKLLRCGRQVQGSIRLAATKARLLCKFSLLIMPVTTHLEVFASSSLSAFWIQGASFRLYLGCSKEVTNQQMPTVSGRHCESEKRKNLKELPVLMYQILAEKL